VVLFAFVESVFHDKEKSIEGILEAVLAETLQVPLKTSVDKSDKSIEINAGVDMSTVKTFAFNMEDGASELQFCAGILD